MSCVKNIVYHYDDIDSVADRITILNFCQVPCVLMSRAWYRSIISFGMLDACCFDIVISGSEYSPSIPIIHPNFLSW